jgi:hypothetical protein
MEKQQTLKEYLSYYSSDIEPGNRIESLLDRKVLKAFSMLDGHPWASWQEFGKEKNVCSWTIVEGGYAVGMNENPSRGLSWPVKKLTAEQVEKYMSHNKTYKEYYNIHED